MITSPWITRTEAETVVEFMKSVVRDKNNKVFFGDRITYSQAKNKIEGIVPTPKKTFWHFIYEASFLPTKEILQDAVNLDMAVIAFRKEHNFSWVKIHECNWSVNEKTMVVRDVQTKPKRAFHFNEAEIRKVYDFTTGILNIEEMKKIMDSKESTVDKSVEHVKVNKPFEDVKTFQGPFLKI